MGMVVDSVSDVITLTAEQVKLAPQLGSALDTDYLIGLGTLDDRMLILVDIDRLMSSDDIGLIAKLVARCLPSYFFTETVLQPSSRNDAEGVCDTQL